MPPSDWSLRPYILVDAHVAHVEVAGLVPAEQLLVEVVRALVVGRRSSCHEISPTLGTCSGCCGPSFGVKIAIAAPCGSEITANRPTSGMSIGGGQHLAAKRL